MSLDTLMGKPVTVTENAVQEGQPRRVFHRSLLRRLAAGRMNDLEDTSVPAIYELQGFGLLVHPTLWAEMKARQRP